MENSTINIIFTHSRGEWTATARIGNQYAGFATCKSKKQAEADARAIAEQALQAARRPAPAPAASPAGRQGAQAKITLGAFGLSCHISELPTAAATAAAAAIGARRPQQRFDEVSTLQVLAA